MTVRIPGLLYVSSHSGYIYIKLAGKESCDIIIHGLCTPLSQSAFN